MAEATETIKDINDKLEVLFKIEDELFNVLKSSGQDSETKYKQSYLDLLDNIKDLRNGLKVLLENHNDTIMDVEYEAEKL